MRSSSRNKSRGSFRDQRLGCMGSMTSSTWKVADGNAQNVISSPRLAWDGRDWSDRPAGSKGRPNGPSGRRFSTEGNGSRERQRQLIEETSRITTNRAGFSNKADISGSVSHAELSQEDPRIWEGPVRGLQRKARADSGGPSRSGSPDSSSNCRSRREGTRTDQESRQHQQRSGKSCACSGKGPCPLPRIISPNCHRDRWRGKSGTKGKLPKPSQGRPRGSLSPKRSSLSTKVSQAQAARSCAGCSHAGSQTAPI